MNKSPHIPALTVLRGISIIFIMFYHFLPQHFPGGFLGVDLFLVLSGYLLHGGFLRKNSGHAGIRFIPYLIGKIRRLWPPLVAMLVFTAAFLTLFQRNLLEHYGREALSSMVFLNNYMQISLGNSYFANSGNPSAITNLWYLSVQFQMYILWFIIFYGIRLLSFRRRKDFSLIVIGICIGLSALMAAILISADGDPTRVYYGTGTRLFTFAIGAMAAELRDRFDRKQIVVRISPKLWDPIGAVALILMLIMMFNVKDTSAWTWRGLGLIFDAACGILLLSLTRQHSVLRRIMDRLVPFHYLGSRSFSLYLWYYPLYILWRISFLNIPGHYGLSIALCLVPILLLGEISYRFFEQREFELPIYNAHEIRHLRSSLRHLWTARGQLPRRIVFVLCTLCIIIGSIGTAVTKADDTTAKKLAARIEENNKKIQKRQEGRPVKEEGVDIADPKASDTKPTDVTQDRYNFAKRQRVTFIGDSLLLASATPLLELFPKGIINGKIGRQFYQVFDVLNEMKSQNQLFDTVVIMLGTNGTIEKKDLDRLIAELGNQRKIFFFTVHAQDVWIPPNNELLEETAKKHSNVYLIPLARLFTEHPDWLEPDGTHPNPNGAKEIASVLLKEMAVAYDLK